MTLGVSTRVLVVLDHEYGDELRAVWSGQPVWIELSPVNEPIIRSFWEENPDQTSLTGITGMNFEPDMTSEERLVSNLDKIDLHHGPYSTSTPYTEIKVIGCPLTRRIRAALEELGFTEFEEQDISFVAHRTPVRAAFIR